MDDLKSFFDKFEKLKQKRMQVQTAKELLDREKNDILKELPCEVPEDLASFITNLEKELRQEISELEIPEEYLDELNSIDRDL